MAATRCETGFIERADCTLPPRPMLLADRGYEADWIRELAARNNPICFNPKLYHACNLIERFFNKIKQWWRVATPYDKLAADYLVLVKLASIRILLRANESTP
jgi:transposase